MLETELDKAMSELERAAQVHFYVIYGDYPDLSDDLSMQPHKRAERITEYLRGLMNMTTKDDGGPAFPQHDFAPAHGGGGYWTNTGGMTLRDWFAGQALAGLCADPSNHKLYDDKNDAARNAYMIADAMLAERKGGAE